MLSVSPSVRIFVYALPADMRKSFDGLHSLVTHEFGKSVMDGDYFVFFNRALDRCKILLWDRDGLVVWAKKLKEQRPQFLLFTESGEYAHNLAVGPVAAV